MVSIKPQKQHHADSKSRPRHLTVTKYTFLLYGYLPIKSYNLVFIYVNHISHM